MQLIGMLDSPYVRRVAISMRLLGLPFEHRSLSVFTTFDEFQRVNPVVKAPTLVCDDGGLLIDSTLILDYAQALAGPSRVLMPAEIGARMQALRVVGLALAACEKTVQIIYERNLRPADKHHQPWLDRILGQLAAAYSALEREVREHPLAATRDTITEDGITAAVAWTFTQSILPGVVSADEHPTLSDFTFRLETLPEFLAFPPDGPGVPSSD